MVSEALAERIRIPASGEAYTLMFGITHPQSRGRLTIASADPHAKPIIDPAYLSAPEDRLQFLGEALDWARRLGGADAYAPWRGEELLPQPGDLASQDARLAFIEHAAFTHHHPVGTCRMGTDAAAVVRPDLSVPGRTGASRRGRLDPSEPHHGTGQCGHRRRRRAGLSASFLRVIAAPAARHSGGRIS